ncbi:KICSTOR complex protein SZT2 [Nymphon striatum]|nr:KICSTOR complex protein SZT2 [Nymphon striatum]
MSKKRSFSLGNDVIHLTFRLNKNDQIKELFLNLVIRIKALQLFDKNGNNIDWWDVDTNARFKDKAQCIIEQYGNFTIPEINMNVNGINTQGENIADIGGLKEAYLAYDRYVNNAGSEELALPSLNYTSRQLFWISAAQVKCVIDYKSCFDFHPYLVVIELKIWCSKFTPQTLKLTVISGVHSPNQFRVNGAFSNLPYFAKDFKCPVDSTMHPSKKSCSMNLVWYLDCQQAWSPHLKEVLNLIEAMPNVLQLVAQEMNLFHNYLTIEDAKEVYLLLNKDYRISRDIRVQWYLNNLYKSVKAKEISSLDDCTSEIEIISIVSSDGGCENNLYRLTPNTKLNFIFHQYCLVFCLDFSPSIVSVDVQHGTILCDEILPALANCISGLTNLGAVVKETKLVRGGDGGGGGGGGCMKLKNLLEIQHHHHKQQCAYILNALQLVLVQGWDLTADNIPAFLGHITSRIVELETSMYESTTAALQKLRNTQNSLACEDNRFETNVKDAQQFSESSHRKSNIHDYNLMNILRYGLMSMQLLPENSCGALVVITDGILSLPDVSLVDQLLYQIRSNGVSCSFLKIGSSYHPFDCFGHVPNKDVMSFIASATVGEYIQMSNSQVRFKENEINMFHKMCLLWTFQKGLPEKDSLNFDFETESSMKWSVRNNGFYSNKDMSVMRTKQSENTLNSNLLSVMACRLREGYFVKGVHFPSAEGVPPEEFDAPPVFLQWKSSGMSYRLPGSMPTGPRKNKQHDSRESSSQGSDSDSEAEPAEHSSDSDQFNLYHIESGMMKSEKTISVYRSLDGQIEITLVYPWRPTVNIECLLRSKWPLSLTNLNCNHEIKIEGNYDFLHDLSSCTKSKDPSTVFRLNATRTYWNMIHSLTQADQILVRLHLYCSNPAYYNVTESSMPLFINQPREGLVPCCRTRIICGIKSLKKKKKESYFKPKVLAEYAEMPLSKHLHIPNKSGGRYASIQCTQSFNSLCRYIREKWCSIILIDNELFINLIFKEPDKPPTSFYIIKVSHNGPCMAIIRIGFFGAISGIERSKVIQIMKRELSEIPFPSRSLSKEPSMPKSNRITHRSGDIFRSKIYRSPLQREYPDIKCCILMNKYDRVPTNFQCPIHKIDVDNMYRTDDKDNRFTFFAKKTSMLTPLSRYLYHKRWIWSLQNESQHHIPEQIASRILSTIIKMRLQEGFNFAYSSGGIINMVLELEMVSEGHEKSHCLLQYVIFPPHSTTSSFRESSISEEEMDEKDETETAEADGELQIITECWIEPQEGFICNSSPERKYLNSLPYCKVPEAPEDKLNEYKRKLLLLYFYCTQFPYNFL